jgi:ribosome-binding ATPase YchF (GTP1/OBG family)
MKTILKNIMLFAAGALTLGFTACEEDGQDLNFNIQPGNELYAPADNASVNLDQGLNTSFEWAPSVAEDGGYITYEVLFDKADGDFSAPLAIKTSQMTGSKASLSISAKELNEVAALAGIENAKTGQLKWTVRAVEILLQYKAVLEQGLSARTVELEKEDRKLVADLNLLTDKPVLYVCNVDEKSAVTGNEHTRAVEAAIADERAEMLIVAAATEADIAELDEYEERQMFLEEIGLKESGVARLIKAAYKLLDLQTFFTTGADESRAWTFRRGMKAPQTAGIIHTDFERGFIRAEVIKYDDYVALGSEKACRDQGKIGVEGKEYVVQDGDVMHFLFNV